jgi:hypothetical protein
MRTNSILYEARRFEVVDVPEDNDTDCPEPMISYRRLRHP